MVEVTYRPMRETDLDDMHIVMSRWDTVRMTGNWPWPPKRDFTASRCKPFHGNGFVWVICHDDRYIGSISVIDGSIGYALHHDYHGQGIMSKTLAAAVKKGFSDGATRLDAGTWHDNRASQRLLEKLGFFHWRTGFDQARSRKAPLLLRSYRLTKADWSSRP